MRDFSSTANYCTLLYESVCNTFVVCAILSFFEAYMLMFVPVNNLLRCNCYIITALFLLHLHRIP